MATATKKATRVIKGLRVNEVSLVPRPKIRQAKFLLNKRSADELTTGGVAWLAKSAEPDRTFVLGPVLVPDTIDSEGDTITAEEIEETAHDFAANRNTLGVSHSQLLGTRQAAVVESYILRTPTEINGVSPPIGTWMLGVEVFDPTIRRAVYLGKLNGFSAAGTFDDGSAAGELNKLLKRADSGDRSKLMRDAERLLQSMRPATRQRFVAGLLAIAATDNEIRARLLALEGELR